MYAIYKVGEDLRWLPGLDLFQDIGLNLTVVPHWNDTEGGATLDTSHRYMGAERFGYLRRMIPGETTILGIDEHTACVLDPEHPRRDGPGRWGIGNHPWSGGVFGSEQ